MVARAKWEKFFAIFCNISTKGKRLIIQCHCEPAPNNTCHCEPVRRLVWQSPSCSENPHRTRRGRCPHRPEMKTYAYTPTLHKRFGVGSSGGNVLVPARTLRRSRLRGRSRKAAPLRTPRPHRRKKVRIFRPASGESMEKA